VKRGLKGGRKKTRERKSKKSVALKFTICQELVERVEKEKNQGTGESSNVKSMEGPRGKSTKRERGREGPLLIRSKAQRETDARSVLFQREENDRKGLLRRRNGLALNKKPVKRKTRPGKVQHLTEEDVSGRDKWPQVSRGARN